MKKFTFLFSMLLFFCVLGAQEGSDGKLKLQKMQKEYSEINQQILRLNKFTKLSLTSVGLKSAAITQKLDSTVSRMLDESGSEWQKDYKDEFFYDEEMRNTSWIEKAWDISTGLWVSDYKAELEYDGNGQVYSMMMYDADSLTDVLMVTGKYNYYYNSEGKPDSVLIYFTEDEGASWDLSVKQVQYYNASKQLIKTETWSYDEDAGALVLGMITNFTYTTSGKIQSSITSFIFEETEYQTSKSEYSYDASDRVISIEYYSLNFFTFDLEKSDRDWFEYNVNGDISVQIYSTWHGESWVDEYKDEFEYGTTDLSEVAFPVFVVLWAEEDVDAGLKYSKAIHLINSYEMVEGAWKHTDITTFYYSGSPSTGIDGLSKAEFRFYPNPTSESVTFNWKENNRLLTVKMYQVTGAKVVEQDIRVGQEISLSKLVNGVYLFKLMNGQKVVYAGKLIKR